LKGTVSMEGASASVLSGRLGLRAVLRRDQAVTPYARLALGLSRVALQGGTATARLGEVVVVHEIEGDSERAVALSAGLGAALRLRARTHLTGEVRYDAALTENESTRSLGLRLGLAVSL
jgi:hypothetical protein